MSFQDNHYRILRSIVPDPVDEEKEIIKDFKVSHIAEIADRPTDICALSPSFGSAECAFGTFGRVGRSPKVYFGRWRCTSFPSLC